MSLGFYIVYGKSRQQLWVKLYLCYWLWSAISELSLSSGPLEAIANGDLLSVNRGLVLFI